MKRLMCRFVAAGLLLTPLALAPRMEAQSRYARYREALYDLRKARLLLEPGVSVSDDQAREIDEIDRAVAQLSAFVGDGAAAAAGRTSNTAELSRKARLKDSLDLVDRAYQSCEKEEEAGSDAAKAEVLEHIDAVRKRLTAESNLVDLSGYQCELDQPCAVAQTVSSRR